MHSGLNTRKLWNEDERQDALDLKDLQAEAIKLVFCSNRM